MEFFGDAIVGLFSWFSSKPKKPAKKSKQAPTAKEIATERGEPWVEIKSIDINPNNPGQGSFELDWNEKFVADLVRHGYMMKSDDTDADIVDRWFTTVCRNVVMETFEQEQAQFPNRPIQSRDIGDGRTEIS